MFDQNDARQIAKKLGAKINTKTRAHDRVSIVYEDKEVASYGIRRSSKAAGHGFLPSSLHLKQKECVELKNCPMSKEQYFKILAEKGLLPDRG